MPERIQRKRAKGWRMPEGAVYVGRQTKWGNPYHGDGKFDPAMVTACYRKRLALPELADFRAEIRRELRGKDLACWCQLDQPCHADVLLELANPPQAKE